MAYDQIVIMCFRTGNHLILVVDGASKTHCEQCWHDVWIAPSSRKARVEMKAKVICEVCDPLKVKPGEIVDVAPIANAQVSEIRDTINSQKRRN